MFFQRGHMTAIAGIVATSIAINSVAPAHAKPSVTDQINTAETSLDRASKSIANIENLPDVAEVERQIAEKHKEITDVEKQKTSADADAAVLAKEADKLKSDLEELKKQLAIAEESENVEAAATKIVGIISDTKDTLAKVKNNLNPDDLEKAQEAVAKAERTAAETEQKLTELREQTKTYATELENAQQAATETKQAIETAKADLQKARAKLLEAHAKDAEATKQHEERTTELNAKLTGLEQDIKNAEARVQELDELTAEYAQLTQKIAADQEHLAESADSETARNAAADKSTPEEIANASERLQIVHEELSKLEQSVRATDAAIANDPELTRARNELEVAQEALRQKKRELDKLLKLLEEQQAREEGESIVIDADDAEPAEDELKQAVYAATEAERAAQENVAAKTQAFEQLINGREGLDPEQYAQKKQQINEKILEVTKLQLLAEYSEIAKLQQQISEAEAKKASIQRDLEGRDTTTEHLANAKKELEQTTAALETHRENTPSATAPALNAKLDELATKAHKLRNNANAAQQKLGLARNRFVESTALLDAARDQAVSTLDTAATELTLSIASLTTELTARKAEGAHETARKIADKLEKAQAELAELEKLRDELNTPTPPPTTDSGMNPSKPDAKPDAKQLSPQFGPEKHKPQTWLQQLLSSFSLLGILATFFNFVLEKFFGIKLW